MCRSFLTFNLLQKFLISAKLHLQPQWTFVVRQSLSTFLKLQPRKSISLLQIRVTGTAKTQVYSVYCNFKFFKFHFYKYLSFICLWSYSPTQWHRENILWVLVKNLQIKTWNLYHLVSHELRNRLLDKRFFLLLCVSKILYCTIMFGFPRFGYIYLYVKKSYGWNTLLNYYCIISYRRLSTFFVIHLMELLIQLLCHLRLHKWFFLPWKLSWVKMALMKVFCFQLCAIMIFFVMYLMKGLQPQLLYNVCCKR